MCLSIKEFYYKSKKKIRFLFGKLKIISYLCAIKQNRYGHEDKFR